MSAISGSRALLFQTGYLTIADEQREGFRTFYRLDYPNLEVRVSLNDELLGYLGKPGREPLEEGRTLCAFLEANDFEGFAEQLRAYLSGIPYQWHATGDLARYEPGTRVSCICVSGPSAWMSGGRTHRVMGVRTWLLLHGRAGVCAGFQDGGWGQGDAAAALDAAIAQMRERGYAEKYRDRGGPVHLIGVACGLEARNLFEIRAEPA